MYEVAAGGLYSESAGLVASETAAGTGMAAGASMFSSLLPVVGIAYMAYSMFSSARAQAKQNKLLEKQAKEQIHQAELLRTKIKRDAAGLYSSVESAARQTTGAMGAIY